MKELSKEENMKAPSIEEKAKAYDDALSVAQETYTTQPMYRDWLAKMFPELKESEDELKWLTKFIEKEAHCLSMDIRDDEDRIKLKNLQKSLAWLEKQGEQKSDESRGMNLVEEKMTPFQREVFGIIDLDIENEQGLKQVCDKLLTLASNEIKRKSAEWSDEDEEYLRRAINAMKDTHPKTTDWLKSLKERVACEANCTTTKQWKPSEEQMATLYKYAEQNNYDGSILTSLYNELKKLREE